MLSTVRNCSWKYLCWKFHKILGSCQKIPKGRPILAYNVSVNRLHHEWFSETSFAIFKSDVNENTLRSWFYNGTFLYPLCCWIKQIYSWVPFFLKQRKNGLKNFMIGRILANSLDTGHKLKVYKAFRRCLGRLVNVFCTFELQPMSKGMEWLQRFSLTRKVYEIETFCCLLFYLPWRNRKNS